MDLGGCGVDLTAYSRSRILQTRVPQKALDEDKVLLQ